MGGDTLRRQIFVFGSNKAGRHGKGAAKYAVENYGAIYGLGFAMQGDCYAIPTKGYKLEVLPLWEIERYVDGFLRFAKSQPDLDFNVTAIGCGLAGYSPEEIAPFFKGKTPNVFLPEEFKKVLDKTP